MVSLQQMMNGSHPYETLPLLSGVFLKDSCAYLISSPLVDVKHEDKKNVLSLNFPRESLLLITHTFEPVTKLLLMNKANEKISIKDFQKMCGGTELKPTLCPAFNS